MSEPPRRRYGEVRVCTLYSRRSPGNRLPDPLFSKRFWQPLFLNAQQFKKKIRERCLSEVSILIAEKMVVLPWQEGICKNYKKKNKKPDLKTLTPQHLLNIIRYSWTNGPRMLSSRDPQQRREFWSDYLHPHSSSVSHFLCDLRQATEPLWVLVLYLKEAEIANTVIQSFMSHKLRWKP